MGAYLSEPVTDKDSTDEIGSRLICGASSMQGWRKTQEDAHNCCLDYDKDASLFAVYDGHGGHEVAVYSAQHLPEYLKNCEAYKKGDYTQALKDAFLGFDATLIKPEILTILKQLAKSKNDDNNSGSAEEEEDEEENVKNLYEEAEMPLEQVMAKYQNDLLNNTKKVKDEDGKSPFLRSKRSCSSGASSSRAGTSSNCSTSHIGETGNGNAEQEEDSSDKKEEDKKAVGSNSDGQSTSPSSKQAECGSSNGDSKLEKEEKTGPDSIGNVKVESIEKLEDDKVSEKVEDDKISEKAEDVKVNTDKSRDEKISNKSNDTNIKKDKLGDENSLGVEVNGEIGDEGKQGVNGDVAEGEGEKGKEKVRISSSLRRRCATALYRSLLESQDNSDSDSDDEGDESFQGAENSSDDEDDDDEDEDDEEEDEEEEDDNDGDGEDEDEEDENENENENKGGNMVDDEEDEDDFSMYMSDKPGLDSGCTAVVALLKGQELYVANAGDSRCVVCRKGQAIEMSLDHKPEDDIEKTRIVKAGGRITGDGRVNGGLNLSRALGDHAYKQSEGLPPEEQMITALPDVRTLMIDPAEDEFMVLACDGIWNFMSSQEVVDFIRKRMQKGETKLSEICEELFDHCLAPKTFGDGTGCDNMTAVIIQFRPELANNTESKSIKRAASPIESKSAKHPRTEETESV